MNRSCLRATTALSLLLAPCAAQASGYAVKEQSPTAQGAAFAGAAARAGDISYMFFNPAAIAFHGGSNGYVAASAIVPSAELSNLQATNAGGVPLGGGDASTDEIALVPATYASVQITDTLTFGLSVNAPFGLVTDYGDAYAGRYHGTHSALTTYNVSPTLAFRPNKYVAVAAGAQIQYADAELDSAVDLGTIGIGRGLHANPALIGNADALSSITGQSFGFGFTLGGIVEPVEGLRLGAGFRSQIEHDIDDGEADFDPTNAASRNLLAGFNGAGVFTDGGAATSVTTPAMLHLGAAYDVTDSFTVMADAHWTQWSVFDELRINFDDNTPDSVTTQDWDDSWYFAVGGEYRPTENLAIRAGVGFDQSPVPAKDRTPRIPDSDRYWGALGLTYEINDMFTLNAAYTYVLADDARLNLSVADPNNLSRGSLTGDISASVHILTVGGQIHW